MKDQLSFPVEGGPRDGSIVEGDEAILDLYWANHHYRFNLVRRVYEYAGIAWLDAPALNVRETETLTAAPMPRPFNERVWELFRLCAETNRDRNEMVKLADEIFSSDLSREPNEREDFLFDLSQDYANWLKLSGERRSRISMEELRAMRTELAPKARAAMEAAIEAETKARAHRLVETAIANGAGPQRINAPAGAPANADYTDRAAAPAEWPVTIQPRPVSSPRLVTLQERRILLEGCLVCLVVSAIFLAIGGQYLDIPNSIGIVIGLGYISAFVLWVILKLYLRAKEKAAKAE